MPQDETGAPDRARPTLLVCRYFICRNTSKASDDQKRSYRIQPAAAC